MPPLSFIHAADLHLDSPFSGLGIHNPELADPLRSATFDAYERVVRLCMEKKVDFLLVAGDVYDGEDRGLGAEVRFRDGLKRLHGEGIRSGQYSGHESSG